jgi:CRISPR-associated endonuclease/helicase Cas3
MTGACEFAPFYRAVHGGREPFPWQRRLAALVEKSGWPAEIGVPTGLGKTSCIDVAVWALARQASRLPSERTAPTRTWYVVNRRLLVDSAFDQAVQLAKLLGDPGLARAQGGDAATVEALRGVADALSTIRGGAGASPLHVSPARRRRTWRAAPGPFATGTDLRDRADVRQPMAVPRIRDVGQHAPSRCGPGRDRHAGPAR